MACMQRPLSSALLLNKHPVLREWSGHNPATRSDSIFCPILELSRLETALQIGLYILYMLKPRRHSHQ